MMTVKTDRVKMSGRCHQERKLIIIVCVASGLLSVLLNTRTFYAAFSGLTDLRVELLSHASLLKNCQLRH
jgi:hypothetical protein